MNGNLTSRTQVAKGAFESVFELSQKLHFNPGQYVTLTLPRLKNDPKGKGRIFSIVNTPKENKILKILYRDTGSPYKNYLLKMPIGEKIKVSDPIGDFAPKPGALVFLVAGIGIAPFMSMLPIKATWFISNKSKAHTPYLPQIPNNPHLIFTNKNKRLNLKLIKSNLPNWTSCIFYIAGAPEFVENLESQLITAGCHPANINREAFDGE